MELHAVSRATIDNETRRIVLAKQVGAFEDAVTVGFNKALFSDAVFMAGACHSSVWLESFLAHCFPDAAACQGKDQAIKPPFARQRMDVDKLI